MLHADPVADPPHHEAGAFEVSELPGVVELGRIKYDMVMNMRAVLSRGS
jgi:hypothetical protein